MKTNISISLKDIQAALAKATFRTIQPTSLELEKLQLATLDYLRKNPNKALKGALKDAALSRGILIDLPETIEDFCSNGFNSCSLEPVIAPPVPVGVGGFGINLGSGSGSSAQTLEQVKAQALAEGHSPFSETMRERISEWMNENKK